MSLIRDADLMQDGIPTPELLRSCITEHMQNVPRLKKLHDYYHGNHSIKERLLQNTSLPNNKLVCNHAEYITDMATGYFLGNPVVYKAEDNLDVTVLKDNFKDVDIHSHDTELARDISMYGMGNELCFASDDEVPIVDFAELSPEHCFLVVDDTVKHKPLFGVHYYPRNDINGSLKHFVVNVYTATHQFQYTTIDIRTADNYEWTDLKEHYFGMVPLLEYKNKKSLQGDFEQVLSLIDAYNLLQSDRVNDKEQLVDALLVVTGASLGDDEEETTQTAKTIKELKLLELPGGAEAKWLTKNLNETEVEVLKKAIKDDIHEFSKVPCLTDENFGSSDSGVALAYKLLAFEMLTKMKENFFRQGLKQRLKLMCNFFNIKGHALDPGAIDIEMTRSLPINRVELVNMVVALEGQVSDETRLSLLDFIDDPKEELTKLKEDLKEKVKQQQQAFGSYGFNQAEEEPPEDGEVDEE